MQYWLHEKQANGCDYTIGCGIRLQKLEATTLEEAVKLAEENMNVDINDYKIVEAQILEVNSIHTIDIPKLKLLLNKQRQLRKQLEQESKDKIEYSRLKSKFENS